MSLDPEDLEETEKVRRYAQDPESDPSYNGFRIERLWAYTQVDPADDQEGVCAFLAPDGTWMPLVASDHVRAEQYKGIARGLARASGRPIKLSMFERRVDIEEIRP